MKKIKISWDEFGNLVEELMLKIKGDFDGVYGIPRGGLVVALCISHKLRLPMLVQPTDKTLIVDEISDTGKTLQQYKNQKIACLFSTPWTEVVPNWFVGTKADKNEWLVMPWEREDE